MKNGRWITRTESSTYLSEAVAIWLRDLRGEFRTRYAVNAILMFAVTTLIAVSFSIGSFRIGEADKPFLYAVLLWIILVFSALSGLAPGEKTDLMILPEPKSLLDHLNEGTIFGAQTGQALSQLDPGTTQLVSDLEIAQRLFREPCVLLLPYRVQLR